MAQLIPIETLDDSRVAGYRDIRDRDLRGAHAGQFVAEGESVVKVLLGPGAGLAESVLVAGNRLSGIAPLLERVDLSVYVAPPELMQAIVGFPIHRGLLALGRRPEALRPERLLAGRPGLIVGLCGITNHDNIGGIFRNMAAFGIEAALLDGATADPYYRKALRVSVGGVLRVRQARVDTAAAMRAILVEAGYRVLALSPSGRTALASVDRGGPLALLLGSEGPGLPEEVLAAAETVRIDMRAGFDSLNVATTSGIALYELTR